MREKIPVGKRTLIVTTAAFALAVGGALGYLEIFTKGLDRLPERPCDGAVARSTVKSILPDARSAKDRGTGTSPGKDFTFFCRVLTSDDHIVSGESDVQDASTETWFSGYEQESGETYGEIRRGSKDDMETLTLDRLASVYVACTPPDANADDALQRYALITEVRVVGGSRVHGNDLRKALTDFAVQLTDHAYKVGKCRTR
ncbi:hypothetical protein K4B79_19610 [Streptomyces lincolnensis]|uniref:hypothetical protein n=1 Tax=Streptomyces lincolnensis TaxID=1915 RepID=UPI001E5B51A4|nr:hypothetical protein [Streptomyces lincolnensis]MCD7440420.1 hypothetical protein [Streptomyces lincolnensis]